MTIKEWSELAFIQGKLEGIKLVLDQSEDMDPKQIANALAQPIAKISNLRENTDVEGLPKEEIDEEETEDENEERENDGEEPVMQSDINEKSEEEELYLPDQPEMSVDEIYQEDEGTAKP